MLQLFSEIYGHDRQLLSDAYEAACDELQRRYGLNGEALGTVVDPLCDAVVSAYSSGLSDQQTLTRYAISQVLDAPVMKRGANG